MPEKIITPSAKIIARKVGNKPYYEIEYYDMEDKITHIGYSSYDLKKVLGWIVEYFEIIPDIDLIKEQPTADVVEVVHAHWIEENDGTVQICSNCGEEHEWQEYRATYCEDCGARMDGKNHDDNSSES